MLLKNIQVVDQIIATLPKHIAGTKLDYFVQGASAIKLNLKLLGPF